MASGPRGSRPSGESDVYTVLLLITVLVMLFALIYTGYQATTKLGGLLPAGGL